jgi:copper oxidase (laccase) domain-containing protein
VIGPSISANVYEVGEEVVDNFRDAGFDISRIVTVRNQSFYLDLWEANKQSLQSAGITDDHIEISGICTFTEHDRFFSARRLGIKSGRIATGIMLKDK